LFYILRTLPNDTESKLIRYQLGKSATSIGANYEEFKALLKESNELKNILATIVNYQTLKTFYF